MQKYQNIITVTKTIILILSILLSMFNIPAQNNVYSDEIEDMKINTKLI